MKLLNGCSLVIHTKNEQDNIIACINSARGVFDEVIVIDMQSEDNTVTLVRQAGARIYRVKDVGFADPVRNYGISKAKYKWILALDADERLSKILNQKLLKIIKEDQCDLVQIPHKNIIFEKWIKHTGWWPDYHYRLFKKGCLIYRNTLHTQPECSGKVLILEPIEENAIIHRGHNSISQLLKKYDIYSSRENHFPKMDKISTEDLLGYAQTEFINRYINYEGFKDGLHGFILSKFREFYRYIEFAKYWEKNGYADIIDEKELQEIIFEEYKLKESNRVRDSLLKNIYQRMKKSVGILFQIF